MHASQRNFSCDEAPDDDTQQPQKDNHSPIRHTLPFHMADAFCGRLLSVCLILTLLLWPAEAVRCFCDRRNCEDALVCTGLRCLVGFKSDVRLDQMCATDGGGDDGRATLAVGECAVDWPSAGGWREVCACGEDFCNTFAFLRHQMSSQGGSGALRSFSVNSGREPLDEHGRPVNPRVDDLDRDGYGRAPDNPNYQSKSLVLLLVVVPLAVGTAAVCLVFVNYHCKMC